MKNKIALLLCMMAVLAFGVLWLFQKQEHLKLIPPLETFKTDAPIVAKVTQSTIGTTQVYTGVATQASKIGQAIQSNARNIEEQARVMLENRNMPINFWGKVIDQDGTPLAGVNIKSQIRHWDFPAELDPDGNLIKRESTTSVDGLFNISGDRGDDLGLKLEKDGYALEPKMKTGFGYGTAERFTASQEKPMIFRMWSTNIHEQLITGEKMFQIMPDGRTYAVDLTKGTISESGDGDLKIWIKRPNPIVFGQRYNWSCEMDVVNGELLQETDSYSSMFLAPSEEYVSSFQFEQKVGSGWGDSTGSKRFYLMLKNGQEYGRMTVKLYAYYNDHIPGLIDIKYAINPSDSRILKP